MTQPLRVLIVEDSPADAELMLNELGRAGFDPRWERVESEADYVARLAPGLDAVLAGYRLPGFDALRALALLQERRLDVPFVVVSGTTDDEAALECLRRGAADYLQKDRLARLGPAVRQAVEAARLRREHLLTLGLVRRLGEETQERLRQTETLLAVARSVSTTLELTETMRRVARELARALGADSAGAYLLDADQQVLRPIAGYHLPVELLAAFLRHPIPVSEHRFLLDAWERQEPVYSANVAADPRVDREMIRHFPHRSLLFVPMLAEGDPVGGLFVTWWGETHRLAPEELRLAAGIGGQAALAVRNATLFAESERRRRAAESLAAVGNLVTRSLDPDEVAQRIADSVRELLGATVATLYRVDPDSEDLVALAVSGDAGPTWGPAVVVPRGTGVSGRAAAERRPVVTRDTLDDPEIHNAPEVLARLPGSAYRAVLAVPLMAKDRVIGALAVGRPAGQEFSQEEVALVQAFADHAAAALDNARLYAESETRRRAAEALVAVGTAITASLDLESTLQVVVEQACRLAGTERGAVALLEPDAPEPSIRLMAPRGMNPGFRRRLHPRDWRDGTTPAAIRERRPVWSADLLADPAFDLSPPLRAAVAAQGYRGVLSVPLLAGDSVLGTLVVYRNQPGPFRADEVQRLEELATQAAIAIENARLYADAERRRREAEIIAALAESINASLDLDTILERVAEGAKELCAGDLARIALREPGSESMSFRYWPGAPDPGWPAARIEPGKGAGGQVMSTGRPFRTAHYAGDPRITDDPETTRAEGAVAEVVVPIRTAGTVAGLLFVSRRSADPFTDHDEAILGRLADHAAIALQNATLLQGLKMHQGRLEALLDFSRELSRIQPLDELLSRISEACGRLLGTDSVGFRVLEGEELVVTGTWGDAREAMTTARLKVGESLSGLVAATGQPLYVPDVTQDSRLIPAHRDADRRLGHRAWIGLPVKAGERLLGVLSIRTRRERGFSDDDVAVAGAFASQAATALDNARLFDEVRDSEERFRSAFEHSGIGMALQGPDGRYLRVNPALCEMLGYAAPELLATSFHGVTHPDDAAADVECDRQMLAGERTWYQRQKRYLHKRGHVVWSLVAISLIRDRDGHPKYFLAQSQDITALKELEDQLRQAQKMEAVGRLAGGVAHDFNNLLTVISGRSQLLLRRLDPADPAHRHVDLIDRTAQRAAGLTQQLLAFSRRQLLRPKVVDLNAIVAGVEKMLGRLIGEDIELVTVRAARLGRIKADPGQLEQVLLNLAVNARDAMPRGGRLTIETANAELDGARFPGAAPEPCVRLTVADTGIGMDADTRARIFEPFFTTKRPGEGTGLGLATVYGIVKQSGGYIEVETAPGQGARFDIYLPGLDEATGSGEAGPTVPEAPRGTETVLLVEDEDAVRALAREVLEMQGYVLLEARNGVEACGLSDRHPGPIHLLLTDVVMPEMSGRELAERLLDRRSGLRVLYMSGYTDDAVVRHGVQEAQAVLLQKPFTPDALAARVREVLDARPEKGGREP